ncbi:MAG: HAD-IC family P-type ATPase, partial [Candidatus Marinimicrobia bacterium]|nr:HAD-IC family P-type ATPase [Candidatus Neomarinimicrobiota bacterium]
VIHEVSQSYLTRLWNHDTFQSDYRGSMTTLANQVSKYFTAAVIILALVAAIYWLPDQAVAVKVFTAGLVVACPCALALSTPFTLGSTLRIFGRRRFYLKNTEVAEALAQIDTIVFDKTGTLTKPGQARIRYTGDTLTAEEQLWLKSVARHSNHPLSHRIFQRLDGEYLPEILEFEEVSGQGVRGEVAENHQVKLGRYEWVSGRVAQLSTEEDPAYQSVVHVAIDDEVKGYFTLTNDYRPEMDRLVQELEQKNYDLALLSGDNDRERSRLSKIFPRPEQLKFNQTPKEKLNYVKSLRQQGKRVLMVGDGLNDAGALAASDVGIAITEDLGNFSPACDAILDAKHLQELPAFLQFAKSSRRIVMTSFGLSFLYNGVGLSFAVVGLLSPLVSAVLMPLSSITVVVFTTMTTRLAAMRRRWV